MSVGNMPQYENLKTFPLCLIREMSPIKNLEGR